MRKMGKEGEAQKFWEAAHMGGTKEQKTLLRWNQQYRQMITAYIKEGGYLKEGDPVLYRKHHSTYLKFHQLAHGDNADEFLLEIVKVKGVTVVALMQQHEEIEDLWAMCIQEIDEGEEKKQECHNGQFMDVFEMFLLATHAMLERATEIPEGAE